MRRKTNGETGRARAARLLRDSRCECSAPSIISIPKGFGKHKQYCLSCGGY